MCGIAGLWDPARRGGDLARSVRAMTEVMVHRGPDGSGYWQDSETGIGLGHRRLSIVDLSAAGHQPMVSADGRWVITYNGEIYNTADLRPELHDRHVVRAHGHVVLGLLLVLVGRLDRALELGGRLEVRRAGHAQAALGLVHALGDRAQRVGQLRGPRVVQRREGLAESPDTRRVIHLASGVRWERLTPASDRDVEFLYVVYPVGAASCPEDALTTHGGREYGYVSSGTLGVQVGFEQYELGPGGSIAFDSSSPHRLWTIGDEPVHAIWVVIGREADPRGERVPSPEPVG